MHLFLLHSKLSFFEFKNITILQYIYFLISLSRYWLQPNVLTAKQPVPSTWTTVLGHPIRVPICIAPTADLLKVAPPDGDILAAQGENMMHHGQNS